jgi:hypothetical protein
MHVGTWNTRAGRFATRPVPAALTSWRQTPPRRVPRRTAQTAERWLVMLAGLALGLAAYTMVQTTTSTLHRHQEPDVPSLVDAAPRVVGVLNRPRGTAHGACGTGANVAEVCFIV